MKLHKDGTVEGTPQEIAEYNRLSNQANPALCNWPPYKQGKGFTTGTMIGQIGGYRVASGATVDYQKQERDIKNEQQAIEDEYKRQALRKYSTKELIEEFNTRTGVSKYRIGPEGNITIRDEEHGCTQTGPAVVLSIMD
ncbi:hypothetical protein D3C73_362300 [compost metagenome]